MCSGERGLRSSVAIATHVVQEEERVSYMADCFFQLMADAPIDKAGVVVF